MGGVHSLAGPGEDRSLSATQGMEVSPEPGLGCQIHENMPSFAASIRFLNLGSSEVPSRSTGFRPSNSDPGVMTPVSDHISGGPAVARRHDLTRSGFLRERMRT